MLHHNSVAQQAMDYGSGVSVATMPLWINYVENTFVMLAAVAGFVLVCLRIYLTIQAIRRNKDANDPN